MAYQALYRKYRPLDFSDVTGQDNIVKTLKNSINLNRVSHAYLFSGPRGTGKTTLAKILAKNINCLNPIDGNCCNKCANCLSILNNECSDIIEIDAASNNGVDEIREIRNKINLVPTQLKYKVYIIDEVHMLSIGAFNALLKTLEEPPEHIIFILATTDPHKVPITIISRCQCFEFKRISTDCIVSRMKKICDIENIIIDDDILKRIATISDGGMRDSLGMLDKLCAYSNGKIELNDFLEINGILESNYIIDILNALQENNPLKILEISDYIESSGKDYIIFIQDIIEKLRKDIINYYKSNDNNIDINYLLYLVSNFNKLLLNLKEAGNIKIMFETSLLSYLNSKKNKDNDYQLKNVKTANIESSNIDLDVMPENSEEKNKSNENLIVETTASKNSYNENINLIINNVFATAKKNYLTEFKNKFIDINDYQFDPIYSSASLFLLDTQVRAVGENEIIITCLYDSILERGINLLDKIEKLLEKIYNKNYDVAIITDEQWENERKTFVNNKNNGIHYEYKAISKPIDVINSSNKVANDNSSIVDSAIELFGKDIVKIK